MHRTPRAPPTKRSPTNNSTGEGGGEAWAQGARIKPRVQNTGRPQTPPRLEGEARRNWRKPWSWRRAAKSNDDVVLFLAPSRDGCKDRPYKVSPEKKKRSLFPDPPIAMDTSFAG